MVSEGPSFTLRGVSVVGASILSNSEVQTAAAPYIGKAVGMNELEEIRRVLTLACVRKGYINSGAVLPDQPIGDGTIHFTLVAGRLVDIRIKGTRHFAKGYIRRRLQRAASVPLDINAMNRSVQVLLQNPGVQRLNVDLEPGPERATALLTATVTESKPWNLQASVANDTPPSVGSIHGVLGASYRNLFHRDDLITLSYGRTGALNDGAASWSVPVDAADTTIGVNYDYDGSFVLDNVFKGLNINSRTQTIGASVDQPLLRTGDETLSIGLRYDHRTNKTFVLGQPFDLSEGAIGGLITSDILRLSSDWSQRSLVDAIAARATFSIGLPDAPDHPRPNDDFLVFLGQVQYIRKISEPLQVLLRTTVQLADHPLFLFEQIALGGDGTVRGYEANQFVRDDAVLTTVEAHYRFYKLPDLQKWSEPGPGGGALELVPFFDFGNGWNVSRPTVGAPYLASIGLGLHFNLGPILSGRIDYGYQLRSIKNPEHDLQDSGIDFQIAAQF
jgi:hemolysin activation/secretion protein